MGNKLRILFILMFGLMFGTFFGSSAEAGDLQCICHDVNHNPHQVCSDKNSQSLKGHIGHITDDCSLTKKGSACDVYGECPCLNAADCDDNNPCTTDACTSGQCQNDPNTVSCDDDNACTDADQCSGGVCSGTSFSCDDGDACTADSCDPVGGCQSDPIACNDANACTYDECSQDSGCYFPTTSCDDGDACTDDSCDAGSGCAHAPHACDDHVSCTVDTCNSPTGCQYSPDDTLCDDHNVCNGYETCDAVDGCQNGTPLNCDDNNPCTIDSCDAINGCLHTSAPQGTVCRASAGLCDAEEICAGAVCPDDAKKPLNTACPDDGVFCTADICDGSNDTCQHPTGPKDGLTCDDSDACTQTDLCQAGACLGSNRIPGVVSGMEYYDGNANGQWDSGEVGIGSWAIAYSGSASGSSSTNSGGIFSSSLASGAYTFKEVLFSGWQQTGNLTNQTIVSQTGNAPSSAVCQLNVDKSYSCQVAQCNTVSKVNFGDLCLGSGGGLTLGFWSNKNGQALFSGADLAAMVALNLRNANGSAFDPASATAFKNWILSATATNMAYMLSAQLAAMKLNVRHNFVSGSALIYAPGTTSANNNGYASVNAIMTEADASLAANGNTVKLDAARAHQEALKNALDNANNNKNFVQSGPGSCGPHY